MTKMPNCSKKQQDLCLQYLTSHSMIYYVCSMHTGSDRKYLYERQADRITDAISHIADRDNHACEYILMYGAGVSS